eukprot:CAMPEP_0177750794 /NCGR_PEP_ID=MMETSP0491_2-20121128/30_1 /TAXON_ID=63592 /ORGANISM="Tetraselmis chuii, Strain PLY429" /LENGTH=608 /DNA_ID=CAMNT_0019265863 /DNA_START=83 /DNA_END=1909 /DNA_ORIENTATION=+
MSLWLGLCAYGVLSTSALIWQVAEAGAAVGTVSPFRDKAALAGSIASLDSKFLAEASFEYGSSIGVYFLESQLSMLVFLNFLCSVYSLLALFVKDMCFGRLSTTESHKLTYMSFKVVFVGAYVTPHILNITAWFAWFALLGFLKVFVGLCKDRLDTLMSAPSATRVSHCRNVGLLLVLFAANIWGSVAVCSTFWGSAVSELMLVLFDCVLIAVDASQTLVRHAIYFVDLWRQSIMDGPNTSQQGLGAHATWEWQGTVLYYTDLLSEMTTLGLSFCHYCHIWYLHGFSFQLIDAILFLNVRAVVCTVQKRFTAFMRYLAATHNLSAIFPDASSSELACSADDCAICKEVMTVAKKLPCGHLFHLHCLRAWLQQSGSDNFTCPMCRAPLFLKPGEAETPLSPQWGETVEASPITSLSRDNTEQSAIRMVMHPPGRLIRAFLGMSATAERVEDVALAVPDLQLDASHFLMFEFEELRARHHGTGFLELEPSTSTSATTTNSASLQSAADELEDACDAATSIGHVEDTPKPTEVAAAPQTEVERGADEQCVVEDRPAQHGRGASPSVSNLSRRVSFLKQSVAQGTSVRRSMQSGRNTEAEEEDGEEGNSPPV